MLKNDFGKLPNGSWVYLNNNGDAVTLSKQYEEKRCALCLMEFRLKVSQRWEMMANIIIMMPIRE